MKDEKTNSCIGIIRTDPWGVRFCLTCGHDTVTHKAWWDQHNAKKEIMTKKEHSSLPWIVKRYYPRAVAANAIVLEHADIWSVPDNEAVAIGISPDNAKFIVDCANKAAKETGMLFSEPAYYKDPEV